MAGRELDRDGRLRGNRFPRCRSNRGRHGRGSRHGLELGAGSLGTGRRLDRHGPGRADRQRRGDGPAVFGRIGALARGDDGSILVADGQALEVRVFSQQGRFMRSFGRGGEGPGECEHIDGLVVEPSGSVTVRDPRLARIFRFAPDGAFEASFRLDRPFLIFSDGAGSSTLHPPHARGRSRPLMGGTLSRGVERGGSERAVSHGVRLQ